MAIFILNSNFIINDMSNIEEKSTESGHAKRVQELARLKFTRSEESGALVGFVTRKTKNSSLLGVRQNADCKKQICLVDKVLAPQIMENVLYECVLIPMTNKNGYIVIDAKPTRFEARIVSAYVKNAIYLVEVKFGNKTIRFDPFDGQRDSVRNIEACREVLEKRVDIKHLDQVVEDFNRSARTILRLMERDGHYMGKSCRGQKKA